MNPLPRILSYIQSVTVVRYIIAGGSAVMIVLAVLYVLTSVLGLWYLASSVVALTIGILISFALQKFWTFNSRSLTGIHVQFSLHIALSLSNIALNTALLYLLVEYARLNYLVAQVCISLLLASMNFIFYRRYIFPHGSPSAIVVS